MAGRWLRIAALLILLLGGFLLDVALEGRRVAEVGATGRGLEGFSRPEWSDLLPGPAGPLAGAYRWMGPSGRLRLGPVRMGRPVMLRLRLCSGRPMDAPWPEVEVEVGGRPRGTFPLAPTVEEYRIVLGPEAVKGWMLEVGLEVEPFRIEGDSRDLGLILVGARVEALGGPVLGQTGPFVAQLRPAYAGVGVAAALGALALGLAFWPGCGVGAGLLAAAALWARWRPEVALQAGPRVAVSLLLLAAGAWGWRLFGPRGRGWARRVGSVAAKVLFGLLMLTLLAVGFMHLRVLAFLLVNGAVFGGYLLWLRRRYCSLADAGVGAFLLSAFQVLVTQMVVAAFGWLRWEVVWAANLLIAASLWGALGRQVGPLLKGVWLRGRAFWTVLHPFPKVILFLLLLVTCWSSLIIWFAPNHDWDGLAYHLPIAIMRAQRGDLARLSGFSPYIAGFPENAEFWILWTLLGTGSQLLADGVPLSFWLFGMLALYSIARRFGARPGPSLIGAALWGLAPVAILQTRTAYNDLTMAALFWLGLNFAFRRPARFLDIILAAVATGLLLGVKYYALLLVPILFLVTLVCSWRDAIRQGWKRAALFFLVWLIACAPSLFWYVANWYNSGNPIWPFSVSIGPLRWPGLRTVASEAIQTPPLLLEMPKWRQLWTVWMENIPTYVYDTRLGGLGPLWVALGLPALAGWLFIERRGWPLCLIGGVVLVLHPFSWWTRHVLFLPGLGGIALAVVLSRVRPATRWIAQALFLAGAVFSLLVTAEFWLANFLFLPPAYRTTGYIWPGTIYRWFDSNSRQPADVLCQSPGGYLALAPLAGWNLEHRLFALQRNPSAEARWLVGSWPRGQAPFLTDLQEGEQPGTVPPAQRPPSTGLPQLERFTVVPLAVMSPTEDPSWIFAVYRVRINPPR